MNVLNEVGILKNRISEAELKIIEKYLSEIPVKLGALANELGIAVFKTPMNPDISGLIQPSEHPSATSGYEIKLNKFEPSERQRFTLAHEIGHFLLHKNDIAHGIKDNVLYRSVLSDIKEREANKVASALIMPIHFVRMKYSEISQLTNDEKVEYLSKEFMVSKAAMQIKLGLT